MDHVPNIRREMEIPMTGRLEGVFADPGDVLECEQGDTYVDVYLYPDGHTETGVTTYAGYGHVCQVNDYESITLPVLNAKTTLTPGSVHIVGRTKL